MFDPICTPLQTYVLSSFQFLDSQLAILHRDGSQAQIVLGMSLYQFRDMIIKES